MKRETAKTLGNKKKPECGGGLKGVKRNQVTMQNGNSMVANHCWRGEGGLTRSGGHIKSNGNGGKCSACTGGTNRKRESYPPYQCFQA